MTNRSTPFTRRAFLRAVGGACAISTVRPVLAQSSSTDKPKLPPFRLGVVVWIAQGESIETAVEGVRALGLQTCQIGFEHLTPAVSKPLKNALRKHGVEATAFSEHGPGERIFDFYSGPKTIGIVPRANREARIRNLQLAADIAAECSIPSIHTHCGFIPEDPNDPLYGETVAAMKRIAKHCKERSCSFLCETGQETPVAMLRMIEDVGLDNVFVNLDGANLIMCGKGNPVDAMDVFGHLVRGIHAKDGLFPTGTKEFGKEVAFGEGKVNFPALFQRLKQVNYQGPVHIEREIEGPEQRKEILRSKAFLETLMGKESDPLGRNE